MRATEIRLPRSGSDRRVSPSHPPRLILILAGVRSLRRDQAQAPERDEPRRARREGDDPDARRRLGEHRRGAAAARRGRHAARAAVRNQLEGIDLEGGRRHVGQLPQRRAEGLRCLAAARRADGRADRRYHARAADRADRRGRPCAGLLQQGGHRETRRDRRGRRRGRGRRRKPAGYFCAEQPDDAGRVHLRAGIRVERRRRDLRQRHQDELRHDRRRAHAPPGPGANERSPPSSVAAPPPPRASRACWWAGFARAVRRGARGAATRGGHAGWPSNRDSAGRSARLAVYARDTTVGDVARCFRPVYGVAR